jgi:hypothetical protein
MAHCPFQYYCLRRKDYLTPTDEVIVEFSGQHLRWITEQDLRLLKYPDEKQRVLLLAGSEAQSFLTTPVKVFLPAFPIGP